MGLKSYMKGDKKARKTDVYLNAFYMLQYHGKLQHKHTLPPSWWFLSYSWWQMENPGVWTLFLSILLCFKHCAFFQNEIPALFLWTFWRSWNHVFVILTQAKFIWHVKLFFWLDLSQTKNSPLHIIIYRDGWCLGANGFCLSNIKRHQFSFYFSIKHNTNNNYYKEDTPEQYVEAMLGLNSYNLWAISMYGEFTEWDTASIFIRWKPDFHKEQYLLAFTLTIQW